MYRARRRPECVAEAKRRGDQAQLVRDGGGSLGREEVELEAEGGLLVVLAARGTLVVIP